MFEAIRGSVCPVGRLRGRCGLAHAGLGGRIGVAGDDEERSRCDERQHRRAVEITIEGGRHAVVERAHEPDADLLAREGGGAFHGRPDGSSWLTTGDAGTSGRSMIFRNAARRMAASGSVVEALAAAADAVGALNTTPATNTARQDRRRFFNARVLVAAAGGGFQAGTG
jgi:hypothetical protein